MNLSQRGLELIKEFEGYHDELPDGRCIAYICPAGKITIGWGCTRGIKLGMIWTKDQAEAALRKELAGHEAAVARLVMVDINSNQRDALISFAYNLGDENLRRSTLLKKLNKGDYVGAQAEFMRWIKHNDPNNPGKKVDSRGLAIRRAKEAALFAERTNEENEVKGEMRMAQAVVAPREPVSNTTKAVAAAAGGGVVAKAGEFFVAGPPPVLTDTVTNIGLWQTMGRTISAMGAAAMAAPVLTVTVILVAGGVIFWQQISSRFGGSQ